MEINFKVLLNSVKMFVFDVDGVLTDGSLLVMPDGEFLRRMNIKDGYAMQLATKKGYMIAIISGGHSTGVPIRLQRLGIQEVHMGVENKSKIYDEILSRHNINSTQVLFMGDDLPDLPLIKKCGIPCCPADAVVEIISNSIYVSSKSGGQGCVRDVIEQVMRVQGNWE